MYSYLNFINIIAIITLYIYIYQESIWLSITGNYNICSIYLDPELAIIKNSESFSALARWRIKINNLRIPVVHRRGDSAFCSLECRQQQMKMDERKDKKKFSLAAAASQQLDPVASSAAGAKVAAKGETVAAV